MVVLTKPLLEALEHELRGILNFKGCETRRR